MMTENEARKLEVSTEWNGRANVCVHCGKVPETFYVATGHDHTDYDIRWCPCREPNPNWCAGCSPDNCSGCGTEPVAYTTPQPEPVESEPAMWLMKHIRSGDLAQAKPNQKALHPRMWSQAHLYTTPQPDRVAELEAALKVAKAALNRAADKFHDYAEIHAAKEASPENDLKVERNLMLSSDMDKALAKIDEVLHD